MTSIILYFATAIIFVGVDFVGLNLIVKPAFVADAGKILLKDFRAAPAILFYLLYAGGLFWFVTAPALRDGASLLVVFAIGAAFGAVAYGTYELTNHATLTLWTWRMVVVDLVWGAFLSGFASAAGLWLTRALKGS